MAISGDARKVILKEQEEVMAAVVNLKVTPGQLQEKARDVSSAVSKMKGDFNRLSSAINGTHNYWIGQAGELHRKLYNDRVEEINGILKLLGDYPTDLLKMAGIYTDAENVNKSAAAALDSNIIH